MTTHSKTTNIRVPRILNTNLRHRKKPHHAPYQEEMEQLVTDWTDSLAEVVKSKSAFQDIIAGLTVATVALPLNLALAVACGLPPSAGLVAGIVGGAVAAIFGGCTLQVTGPAAALSTIILGIAHDFGGTGVMVSCLVIGVVQFVLSLSRAGKLAKFAPEAVLVGFTTGVGLKLLDNQIPVLLGFDYSVVYLAQMMHRPTWLHEVSWNCVVSGLFVVFVINALKHFKKFPAALMGVVIVTAISVYLKWDIQRVGTVPSKILNFGLPVVADNQWINLILRSVPMGLLAAVETLLSAQIIDRMSQAQTPHNPNLELFGQGMANFCSGLFGGMPVTGVVVRSSVNVQSGGKTKLASLLHALALFFAVLFLNHSIAQIPLAGLAGLLCVVGVRLIDIQAMHHLYLTSKSELLAFLVTAAGTASGHLEEGLLGGLAIYGLHYYFHLRPQRLEAMKEIDPLIEKGGIRAVLTLPKTAVSRNSHYTPAPRGKDWLMQIQDTVSSARSAFVHHHATVIGRVVLGDHVHIAPESSIRADEGTPFFIGSNSNIQDGVVLHALKDRWITLNGGNWAIYIGENVSIAHQALVHGPCFIGNNSFIGFKAVVHNSVIGSHCYIGIGAVVVGVEIPDGHHVPHGMVVDTADKVEALQKVTAEHLNFNEDVVDVNRGLAAAYHENKSNAGKNFNVNSNRFPKLTGRF